MLFDACFIGRITPLKGLDDLIDIWEMVVKEKPNATLAIIGKENKKYADTLKVKIEKKFPRHNISIYGAVSEQVKAKALSISTLFVSPSYEEGWGIAIQEALYWGVPVVAYDLPAYDIFGIAVSKVPIGDKEQFAKKILDLLDNELERYALGGLGQEITKDFTWDNIVGKDIWEVKHTLKHTL